MREHSFWCMPVVPCKMCSTARGRVTPSLTISNASCVGAYSTFMLILIMATQVGRLETYRNQLGIYQNQTDTLPKVAAPHPARIDLPAWKPLASAILRSLRTLITENPRS